MTCLGPALTSSLCCQSLLLLHSNASLTYGAADNKMCSRHRPISVCNTCLQSTVLRELRDLCSLQSQCGPGLVGKGCILSQAVWFSSPNMVNSRQLQDASLIEGGARFLLLSRAVGVAGGRCIVCRPGEANHQVCCIVHQDRVCLCGGLDMGWNT